MRATFKILLIFLVVSLIFVAGCTSNDGSKDADNLTETIKCIGENSVLYTQKGCLACDKQEMLLGDNMKYINLIDCYQNPEACQEAEIMYVPTWIIDGKKITGVQTVEVLKALTGC